LSSSGNIGCDRREHVKLSEFLLNGAPAWRNLGILRSTNFISVSSCACEIDRIKALCILRTSARYSFLLQNDMSQMVEQMSWSWLGNFAA
jgi:hypothetical protein